MRAVLRRPDPIETRRQGSAVLKRDRGDIVDIGRMAGITAAHQPPLRIEELAGRDHINARHAPASARPRPTPASVRMYNCRKIGDTVLRRAVTAMKRTLLAVLLICAPA